jgi:hypothetical protein
VAWRQLYKFEEIQQLRFDVFDADSDFKNNESHLLDTRKQDFQGFVTCSLAEICGAAARTLTKPLQHTTRRVQGA